MNASSVEREAEAAALRHAASLFQRPDQLEKLDSQKKRADRKKAAVEAMLRTAVQSQLEGIRTAMNHLQSARSDVGLIEKDMHEVLTRLQTIPSLKANLSQLAMANMVHSQYAAAMDNLKHIFNINETVENTHEFILNGNLLNAHKNIMELENARDDLMNEVYKLDTERRDHDINLLKSYFSDVEKLVAELGKQLWYICSRALEAVRGEGAGPSQLVSALRIIEREQRIDDHYKKAELASPNAFIPPGRPRMWKRKLFEVLKNTARQRIEGNQLEDRQTNKQWLVRYLEVCRVTVVEDLKVVKSALVPCFPPAYSIYDRYIKMYHDCLSSRIREVASEQLEKNELVQLLSWVKGYGGEYMLGHPKLGIETGPLLRDHPLLPRSTNDQLFDQFVEVTQRDMTEWLDKALAQEQDEWKRDDVPEMDSNRCYYTQLPSILFGMVEDQVKLAKEISAVIVPRIIEVSVDCFLKVSVKYRVLAENFKAEHYDSDRNYKNFTKTVISVANNMDICSEFTDKWDVHIRLNVEGDLGRTPDSPLSPRSQPSACFVNRDQLIGNIERLKEGWQTVMHHAIAVLIDELNNDIARHLDVLFTKTWLRGSSDLGTICLTVQDYYNDYIHLRPHIRLTLIREIAFKLIGEYVRAIGNRRLTFSSYEDRQRAANLLKRDAEAIDDTFHRLQDLDFDYPGLLTVVPALADILDLRDKSLLTLEATSFVRKFPDAYGELLANLLSLREDLTRQEAREVAQTAMNNVRHLSKGDQVMQKFFQGCKSEGGRTVPALEETMHNMFATMVMTANASSRR